MASTEPVVWRVLSSLWLAILALSNLIISPFRKPAQPDQEAPPILPFTVSRDDGTDIAAPNAVDQLAEAAKGSCGHNSQDFAPTTRYITTTQSHGPPRLSKAAIAGLHTKFAAADYSSNELAPSGEASGSVPNEMLLLRVRSNGPTHSEEAFGPSQRKSAKRASTCQQTNGISSGHGLDDTMSTTDDSDSTSGVCPDSAPSVGSCSSTGLYPAPGSSTTLSEHSGRREIIIDFSELGTYAYSVLSASSTCALGDIPSSNKCIDSECVPLPTPHPALKESVYVAPTGIVSLAKPRGRISLTSYPDGCETTMDEIFPSDSLSTSEDASDESNQERPITMAEGDLCADKQPSPVTGAKADRLPELPSNSSLIPNHAQFSGPLPISSPSSSASPEKENTVPLEATRAPNVQEKKDKTPTLNKDRLGLALKTLNIEGEVKKVDTPDRDRYRGAGYSKAVVEPLSPSLSLMSLHAASPPLLSKAETPNSSPILSSSPSVNGKPRTIRVVHDMTIGRNSLRNWMKIATGPCAQENDGGATNAGNARRRTSIPLHPDARTNGLKKAGGDAAGGQGSVSKSTGCRVKSSTSSPGLTP